MEGFKILRFFFVVCLLPITSNANIVVVVGQREEREIEGAHLVACRTLKCSLAQWGHIKQMN